MSNPDAAFALSCPIPVSDYPTVMMAHGGGGKLMHHLIEKMFVPAFSNSLLEAGHDGAVLDWGGQQLAFTTDSYVVQPLFFPGGDIGHLAVNGTVNDLAMCGARPLYLSIGMILEEGLPMPTLWRVVQSLRQAAQAAGVQLVTGDTKVVDRGKGDQVFINTAGIGTIAPGVSVHPGRIQPGDVVLLNGDIARHGIAITALREGLNFETTIESDCAPLASLVMSLLEGGIDVHCLRDMTRGGMATTVVELAESCGLKIELEQASIPVREDVQSACEVLGFDPLYVANEGRFVAFVSASQADRALELMRRHPLGEDACRAGRVSTPQYEGEEGLVTLKTRIGAVRIVDMISGEQLPRIC